MLGLWTRKDKDAYLHVFRWPGREAVIPLVRSKPVSATIMQTGRQVQIRHEYNGRLVLSGMPEKSPHPAVTTIKIRFNEVPQKLKEKNLSAWLTGQVK